MNKLSNLKYNNTSEEVIFWGFSHGSQRKSFNRYRGKKVLYTATEDSDEGIFCIKKFEDADFSENLRQEVGDVIIPNKLSQKFFDNYNLYAKQFSRCLRGLGSSTNPDKIRSHFWTLLQWYFSKYQKKSIRFAIFAVPPHFGYDKLMADYLHWRNIPVYFAHQTLFPNQFLLYDYSFEIVTPPLYTSCASDASPPSVEKEELIYMKDLKSSPPRAQWLRWTRKYFKSYFQKSEKKEISRIIVKSEISYYKNLSKAGTWDYLSLEKRLSGKEFIYFPLHLQPEMTTSMLGGKYSDQALALEHLSRTIPKNMVIVVKENPKQLYKERTGDFFKRMNSIENLIFIGKSINSKLLISKCVIVATITGTAGWEAIRMGKPVIIFGKAWYRNFNGVYSFHNKINISSILKKKFSSEITELDFKKFNFHCWKGVVDAYYQDFSEVSEYQSCENLLSLFNYLYEINNIEMVKGNAR